MTSITKHQNDFTNGKSANKENVSSNGKQQSEVTIKSSSGIDSNFDWAEKQAISQQRKSRLIQVRQKSKEIAAQVRENVRKEENRQIENINRIKRDEWLIWRQKQAGIIEMTYEKCLERIGEAHLNAARENAKQQQFEEQKEKNRKLALKRGKIAAQKLKDKQNMKPAKQQPDRMKEKQVVTISKTVHSSPESVSDTSTSSTSSTDSSDVSVILVENKKKPEVKISIPTTSSKTGLSPKRSTSAKPKSPVRSAEYNPTRYASANNSTSTDVSYTDSPMSDAPPIITKVSDLLGRKPTIKTTALRSSPHIAKIYKLDNSPVTSRTTTRKTTQQKPQINTVSSRLSRAIKTPSKISGKSPMKLLPERKHFVPEFVKSKKPTSTTTTTQTNSSIQTTTPQNTSKVQFYDHANKYSRQYDGNIDLIEKVQNIKQLDAWEEAKKEVELDEINRNGFLNMKKLAENRSKVALEKEKIRRDYDLMSIQLKEILENNELANSFLHTNDILSESRLKQLAEEKQQLMNGEFSKVLEQSTIITCPKINANDAKSSSSKQRGVINVAQANTKSQAKIKSIPSKQPPPENVTKQSQKHDTASESAHSLLLDYVTERSNNICEDISRCHNGNNNDKNLNQEKITALHELLNKVNSFRRILCEEIKQNNGDVSRIDASQFMSEIEKVEVKQQEIMKDKSVGKTSDEKQSTQKQNREQELRERERLLKMKESCIDEKVRELYLREKKIEELKKKSKKEASKLTKDKKAVAVVTSNGEAESLDEIPVRIVINVNKNEQSKEKFTEVVLDDMKWGEKLKKSSKENIQPIPVTNATGKIYPKTPAKPKVVTVERKQHDISSSSTTSFTAYYSPPEQIKTQLTTKMEQRAITASLNVQSPDENPQISDRELLHYIIRMLGMSRSSIGQLNMSSVSTVKTPNSSIVNSSSNRQFISSSTSTPISHSSSLSVSMEQLQSIDKAKLQQLAKFLAENNNLASKTRKDSKESGVSNDVWDEILSKRTEPISKSEETESEQPKPTKSPPAENDVIQDPDEKLSRDDLIAKYDELAANCTKRIINLDTMISKVREEKQKLLENTLSSASSLISGQKEATEYLEYPQQERNQQAPPINNNNIGSPLSDSKGTNAPSSDFSSTSGTADTSMPHENRAGLFTARDKPLGESKDSGVGNSRPVTSSDYRESPDLKQNTKNVDSESQSKLLQNALRESREVVAFEPLLKDIPKSNLRITAEGQLTSDPEQERSPEQIPTNIRDKTVKPSPPVAMARYSPHMDDELPHELSTITEVDTPATSRLNATDVNNINDTRNNSIKLLPDDELLKFLYKTFPDFKDYIKLNPNISEASLASVSEIDLTVGTSAIADERLAKLLEPFGSQIDELKYKTYEGERPDVDSKQLDDSELRMSYSKFPTHSEYAKSVPGLLDSQSLDQMHITDTSDANDNSSNSSLPDIVNELKSRNILKHSFEEAKGNGEANLDDLLIVHGDQKAISLLTTKSNDDTLTEELENELYSMGMAWVSAELKKSKKACTLSTSSQSSDSSNHTGKMHRSTNKQLSSGKPKTMESTFRKINQSKATDDSFVDKNLVATNSGTIERTVTTQKSSETEQLAKSINLKEFLARQLLKHSSTSSSSSPSNDSSLASIFLKSFLAQSYEKSSDTPQIRGTDKQRTSTPVNHSSEGKDSSSKRIHTSTIKDLSKNNTESPTFFSNDSHQLSSVRMSSTASTSSAQSDERQK